MMHGQKNIKLCNIVSWTRRWTVSAWKTLNGWRNLSYSRS